MNQGGTAVLGGNRVPVLVKAGHTSTTEGTGDSFQGPHATWVEPGSNCLLHALCTVIVGPHGAIHQLYIGRLAYAENFIGHL